MLKKFLPAFLLIWLLFLPVSARADYPDCSGVADLTLDLPQDSSGAYQTSTQQDITVHASFKSGYDSTVPYTILISSAQQDGTPLRSLVSNLPLIGGIFDILFKIPIIGGQLGDMPLPIGNDDSESAPAYLQSDGTADFFVPSLTKAIPHYLKIKKYGSSTPLCVNSQPINVTDANDVTIYNCKSPNSVVGSCIKGGGKICSAAGYDGIETVLGCIPTDPKNLVDQLLRFFMGVSGGIALLIMAIASFQMITSQGSAENLKNAHARFIDAIVGLLFIIFATLILQIIGFTILNIPGFHP